MTLISMTQIIRCPLCPIFLSQSAYISLNLTDLCHHKWPSVGGLGLGPGERVEGAVATLPGFVLDGNTGEWWS